MSRIYLISCDYLKTHTAINNNVADELLNSAIYEAQTIHIQQLIGTKLYNKVCELVGNNTIGDPANADYKILLDDYLQCTIAYWAVVECIPTLAVKLVNKGLERQNSEWSSPAAINEIEYLRDNWTNKAQFYSQRITDFLLQNRSKYPEYMSSTQIDELRPNNGNYFSGIVFDDGSCPCERTMGYNRNAIDLI